MNVENVYLQTLNYTDQRELGSEAVFTISSAKPGNGVEQLRDDSLETYWQSDGLAPHLVNIQFNKKATVSQICFYCDFTLDESYTPKRVCIRSGTTMHDLVDITTIDLNDPKGWISIDLPDITSPHSDIDSDFIPLRTHMLQLRVLSMHQNGRDTHIRQIKILGPRSSLFVVADTRYDNFKTSEMLQYAQLR
jgi:anaphase-promoting complex subunit 10